MSGLVTLRYLVYLKSPLNAGNKATVEAKLTQFTVHPLISGEQYHCTLTYQQ